MYKAVKKTCQKDPDVSKQEINHAFLYAGIASSELPARRPSRSDSSARGGRRQDLPPLAVHGRVGALGGPSGPSAGHRGGKKNKTSPSYHFLS